jgi:hypothetical protein
MDKASSALINLDYSIFPKASDQEETAEIGWLLYSTRYQDEERFSELLSTLVQERIRAKWRPIRTNDRYKKDPKDPTKRMFALHLEGASNRAGIIQQKLGKWYGSKSKVFPDGTKMRLVPPFQSIISFNCKQTCSSLVARQATLMDRLCSSSKYLTHLNQILDSCSINLYFPFPPRSCRTNLSFTRWTELGALPMVFLTLTFIPENESEARLFVAGLIPFIKATHSPWFLKFFSEEAQLRHLNLVWDEQTRRAYSAEEAELDKFLANDNELNMTSELSGDKHSGLQSEHFTPRVANLEKIPTLYRDMDSVSTFHPITPSSGSSTQPSTVFQPRVIPTDPIPSMHFKQQ